VKARAQGRSRETARRWPNVLHRIGHGGWRTGKVRGRACLIHLQRPRRASAKWLRQAACGGRSTGFRSPRSPYRFQQPIGCLRRLLTGSANRVQSGFPSRWRGLALGFRFAEAAPCSVPRRGTLRSRAGLGPYRPRVASCSIVAISSAKGAGEMLGWFLNMGLAARCTSRGKPWAGSARIRAGWRWSRDGRATLASTRTRCVATGPCAACSTAFPPRHPPAALVRPGPASRGTPRSAIRMPACPVPNEALAQPWRLAAATEAQGRRSFANGHDRFPA